VALGVWANVRGFESSTHRTFAAQAAAVRAGGPDLAGLEAAYPPLPTLLAGLVPGGSLGLSGVASLFAGCTLHLVWEQLVRRDVPTLLIGCLLLPLFAVPAVAYAASQSVAGIVLLSMLAVAVHGFVRFTVNRDTEAGFLTGLGQMYFLGSTVWTMWGAPAIPIFNAACWALVGSIVGCGGILGSKQISPKIVHRFESEVAAAKVLISIPVHDRLKLPVVQATLSELGATNILYSGKAA